MTTQSLEERIARFENMAEADPTNDMAHFSLGSAYLQADRAAEASRSLLRAIELNPDMSKAYELAGGALIKAGWEDQAVQTLAKGHEVATSKGDVMPREAIEALFRSIGREPPKPSADAEKEAEKIRTSGTFVCRRTGRPGSRLTEPPMRGPVGAWIQENIAEETWREWIGQGTKVINELRLDFSREQDQDVYDQQMCEYLGIEPELFAKMTAGS